jgi:hypothetical protein
MTGSMTRTGIVLALLANLLLALGALPASSAEVGTADDTARLLAGLPPSASSPLQPLTRDHAWRLHERAMTGSFESLERRQLSKIRTWSRANLKTPKSALFYMFSGPDFLYADTFFPSASTYVLSGLEPVGQIPDLSKLTPAALAQGLNGLRYSLRSVLSSSFFITSYMGHDLRASRLTGTLPILYVFLARTGHTIQEAGFVNLNENGELQTSDGNNQPKGSRGIKIVFSGADHETRTLYYFSTNLADGKFGDGPFARFCEKLKEGDGFVKSASYALHGSNFSQVRRFLLDHSATIVQDDTGIPVGSYDPAKWQVRPFGNYVRPLPVFSRMYQPKMHALFRTGRPNPIDFGIGYRSRPGRSGLLVATRKESAAQGDASKP